MKPWHYTGHTATDNLLQAAAHLTMLSHSLTTRKRGDYQNCSVLYTTVVHNHKHT